MFIASSLKLTTTGRKTPSYSLKTDRPAGQSASVVIHFMKKTVGWFLPLQNWVGFVTDSVNRLL